MPFQQQGARARQPLNAVLELASALRRGCAAQLLTSLCTFRTHADVKARMLIDLITYTTHSPDGCLSAEDLIECARTRHLGGLCIADREHSKDAARWVALGKQAGIFVGVGVEIVSEEGLLVAFPPTVDEVLTQERWRSLCGFGRPSAQSVIDYFDALGGATVLGPLYDQQQPLRMGDHALVLHNATAIDAISPTRNPLDNDLSLEMALALSLPPIGASRALTHLNDIGKVATLFTESITEQATLVALLRAGDAWAVRLSSATQHAAAPRPRSEHPRENPREHTRSRDRDRPRDPETEQPERRPRSRRFMLD